MNVVITGGTAGIGRATAELFAQKGANVAVLARGEDRLRATEDELRRLGVNAIGIQCDVADYSQVEAAAERVEKELGPIDIWINNAMVSVFAPVDDIQPEEFKRVTEVTYLGQVHGTLAALKRMKPRNRGSIVLVGSALAYRGIPLQSAYCAAKHAIQGFADSLRVELLHDKSQVRLSMVQLPGVNTPQFSWVKTTLPKHPRPLGGVYQPEVAAEAIYWAAMHKRRELMVSSPVVTAIVSDKLAPKFDDWALTKIGFDGQQTEEPIPKDRPHNLWEPLPGLFGSHGIFDSEARTSSKQLAITTHRKKAALAALGLAGVMFGAWTGYRRLRS
jgi:NAD(P)-dependent dehydrogenase (short-subunit alcohol dehydrogenase family)